MSEVSRRYADSLLNCHSHGIYEVLNKKKLDLTMHAIKNYIKVTIEQFNSEGFNCHKSYDCQINILIILSIYYIDTGNWGLKVPIPY